jgi:tetratricopeptide (TPR) repeat protein
MNEEKFAAAVDAEESGHPRLAKRLYEECLTIEPLFGAVWLRYLGLLQQQEDYAKAIASGERVLACELNDLERSLAYNILGQCHIEQGNFAAAEESFRRSQKLTPESGTCVFLYITLLRQQREEEGVAFLREALRLDERYEEAHYNLGCYYQRAQQDEEAERCFRRAIALDPEYGRAFAELGSLVAKKGKEHLPEASQHLARAVSLEPNDGWVRLSYAKLLWRRKELSEAEVQYQSVLTLRPKDSVAYWSYGQFLSDTEQNEDKAEALLTQAITLSPEDAQAHKLLGRHLLRYGKLEGARASIERAITLGDKDALRYLRLIEKHE